MGKPPECHLTLKGFFLKTILNFYSEIISPRSCEQDLSAQPLCLLQTLPWQ